MNGVIMMHGILCNALLLNHELFIKMHGDTHIMQGVHIMH